MMQKKKKKIMMGNTDVYEDSSQTQIPQERKPNHLANDDRERKKIRRKGGA